MNKAVAAKVAKDGNVIVLANNAGVNVLSGEVLEKTSKALILSASKLGVAIHEHLINLMAHAQQHGDVTRLCAFVTAMPASQRRETMKRWLMTYSPVNVDEGNLRKPGDTFYRVWDIASAQAKPYYDFKEPKATEPFDFEAMAETFDRYLKRIDKALTDGNVPAHEVEGAKALKGRLLQFKAREAILMTPVEAAAAAGAAIEVKAKAA